MFFVFYCEVSLSDLKGASKLNVLLIIFLTGCLLGNNWLFEASRLSIWIWGEFAGMLLIFLRSLMMSFAYFNADLWFHFLGSSSAFWSSFYK